MKSSTRFFGLAFVFPCSLVFGQNPAPTSKPETPTEKKQDVPGTKEKSEEKTPLPASPRPVPGKAKGESQPGYGHDAMVDRRLAAFVRLRELMFEKVTLDSDKRKKIDLIFDDYMAGLLNPQQKPHIRPSPHDAASPQELPELRKQLEEAQKGDDKAKIESIKAKIYYASIVLEPSVMDEPVFFFDYVNKELTEEQRKEFEPILNRWLFLRVPEVAPDNDFKQVRRSTRDPLLIETGELGKQLDEIIIESMRTIPLGEERRDIEVMKKLAADTKPKVLEKLNPKQREHFEKTLDMLKRWDKEDPEIAKKTRERLKDHRPSHRDEKTSAAPAQKPAGEP